MRGIHLFQGKSVALVASLLAMWAAAAFAGEPANSKPLCKPLAPYDVTRAGSYSQYYSKLNRQGCLKPWTVLVYMAADNDLSPFALADLYEMEAGYAATANVAGSGRRADVVVQLDSSGDQGLRRIHLFQSKKPYDRSLKIEDFKNWDETHIESPTVEMLPEDPNIPEGKRLDEFLNWGMSRYPAQNYLVIVWGHGNGWNGGVAYNSRTGTSLDIPSLKRALNGKPIDVYASDACLMQMLEVVTELSGNASYIVGTSDIQDHLGLPYRRILYEINTGKADTPFTLAKMLPKIQEASFSPHGLQGRLSPDALKQFNLSTISTDELKLALIPSLRRLGLALSEYLTQDPMRGMDLQIALKKLPTLPGGALDLGATLMVLKTQLQDRTPSLELALDQAHDALERTVTSYQLGTDYNRLLGFRGISLWMPSTESEYKSLAQSVLASDFYQEVPEWQAWLQKLYVR